MRLGFWGQISGAAFIVEHMSLKSKDMVRKIPYHIFAFRDSQSTIMTQQHVLSKYLDFFTKKYCVVVGSPTTSRDLSLTLKSQIQGHLNQERLTSGEGVE